MKKKGPMKLMGKKKSAAKKMVDTSKLKPGAKKLVEGVASKNTIAKMKKAAMKLKEEEKSVMTMKKAAMKLKKDSAMMMKKAAMKMKKVSAMKMKMKKKK